MAPIPKPVVSVQVRELVEFALRGGDLGGARDFVGPRRALAGIRGHQRLQRSRPAGYEREVRLSRDLDAGPFLLRIQGRIDGVLTTGEGTLLEEIKTVQGRWDGVADPLHWAQAKIYGFLYAVSRDLKQLTIQLTYLHLETGQETEMRERFALETLAAFFEHTTALYLEWVRERFAWCQARDQSIRQLTFPFSQYRPGQRQLAVAAYRTLSGGGRLFLEAPTGIGKTISVLFPAIKALGEGKLERIFYLTARTVGRAVAEKALNDLRTSGLRARTLALTAKEKICLQDGQPCDAAACPFAQGYFDRYKPAMRDALQAEAIGRLELQALGQRHRVCPFELSLDLSVWVDAVICDYNYLFDPRVYLRRHFGDEPTDYAFLVDEAHNLVDRAREMFSAELESREIRDAARAIKSSLPRCAKALTRLCSALKKTCGPASDETPEETPATNSELELFNQPASAQPIRPALHQHPARSSRSTPTDLASQTDRPASVPTAVGRVSREFPAGLAPALDAALTELESWLAKNQPADFREQLLELYFRLYSFGRTAALFDECYVAVSVPGDGIRVRLLCLDPSRLLQQALARGKAAVFFSATLTPLDYYRALLGGDAADPVLQLPSPFPPENLAVLIQDRIRTQFNARAESLPDVAQAIGALTEGRPGNYMVYLPSYVYLANVQAQVRERFPNARLLAQRPGMSEAEREEFLAAFAVDHAETLVGFAVMGGVFGEGIDLVGDRLLGAVIVGVGLPQLCLERDLIRDYFQEQLGAGFDYAYTFPGMNRVLQAMGRVIRSERDRGVVLLVDTRFAQNRYRSLFPSWWRPRRVRTLAQIRAAVRSFWQA